jgi:hypothetical protein
MVMMMMLSVSRAFLDLFMQNRAKFAYLVFKGFSNSVVDVPLRFAKGQYEFVSD